MINIILFLFFIGCISLAAAMVADNPGTVAMIWFDHQIETSVAFIILLIALVAIATMLFTLLFKTLISVPSKMSQRRKIDNLNSGITELTYSISALASSNIDAADKHVRKVEKLIGRTPLTLLLSAQISKNRGDEKTTQVLLEQLLEHKETEYLAARSLSESASKQDNLPKALQLAKKAQVMNPADKNSALAVASLHVRLKQWNEALNSIAASKLPRRDKKRLKALIQLSYGQNLLEHHHDEEALGMANSIIHILYDFAPAVAFVANTYQQNNMTAKAIRLVTKSYKKHPSRLLEETFEKLISYEPQDRRIKLRAKLIGDIENGTWNCNNCGSNQPVWNINCDSCFGFNSLEWK